MIATGGLLRFNTRRQDSLRVKTHKPQPRRRKSKRKSRNEVVVVKGKLKLVSASGLVAALGVLVLLVGLVVAALGYWPRDGLFFTGQPHEGATMASVSISSSEAAPADAQKAHRGEDNEERGGRHGFNQTQNMNRTWVPRGFLEVFLDRCLYSDRLKVLGPLIMGIGIFLFICANAVLHENRDKNTKVINLRDIYSTVIDLNRLRGTRASCRSSANGLVNYSQSQSLETRTRSSCTSPPAGGGAGGGGASPSHRGTADGGGETVFSVCAAPSPPSSLRGSLPTDPPPSSWSPLQKEVLSSFTLPLRHPRPPAPHRRHSAGLGWVEGGREVQSSESELHRREEEEEEEEVSTPPTGSSPPPPSCSSYGLHWRAPPTNLLLSSSSSLAPSHLSLSSVSHLLSSSPTPPPPSRRRSLPTARGGAAYTSPTHGLRWEDGQRLHDPSVM
ncbi:uncharacterized protein V6R79_020666 [Siganus canaliculatus]